LENILLHKQVLAALYDQTLEAQPARWPHHGHLQQDYREHKGVIKPSKIHCY
jgi:hypothetical protein